MHVQRVRTALGRLETGVVDAVEEVLERPRHVADVGGGAEQVPVGGEHVRRGRGQRRPHGHLDALDLLGGCPRHDGLIHRLQRGRAGVVDDQQGSHQSGTHRLAAPRSGTPAVYAGAGR